MQSPYYVICVVILLSLMRHATAGFHDSAWYYYALCANTVSFVLLLCGQYGDQHTSVRMTFFYILLMRCLLNSM